MKQLFNNVLYSALCLSLCFTACNKQDDEIGSPGVGGSMNASVNGNTWAATYTTFNKTDAQTISFTGERNATGSDGSGIGIVMTAYNNTGSYTIDNSATKAYYIDYNTQYTATSGTIDVTTDDDTWFKANFSFESTDSLNTAIKTVSGSFTYRKK